MKELEERILKDAIIVDNDIIKVESFINHQIDIKLIKDFAKEVKEEFINNRIDKILTIETSGIAVAFAVAEEFDNIPVVYAKKGKVKGSRDVYKTKIKSLTTGIENEVHVTKSYLNKGEHILIVDDFLAEGNSGLGLIDICEQAKSQVIGFVAMIEKYYQGGRDKIASKGVTVYSGAVIKEFKNNKPEF